MKGLLELANQLSVAKHVTKVPPVTVPQTKRKTMELTTRTNAFCLILLITSAHNRLVLSTHCETSFRHSGCGNESNSGTVLVGRHVR